MSNQFDLLGKVAETLGPYDAFVSKEEGLYIQHMVEGEDGEVTEGDLESFEDYRNRKGL